MEILTWVYDFESGNFSRIETDSRLGGKWKGRNNDDIRFTKSDADIVRLGCYQSSAQDVSCTHLNLKILPCSETGENQGKVCKSPLEIENFTRKMEESKNRMGIFGWYNWFPDTLDNLYKYNEFRGFQFKPSLEPRVVQSFTFNYIKVVEDKGKAWPSSKNAVFYNDFQFNQDFSDQSGSQALGYYSAEIYPGSALGIYEKEYYGTPQAASYIGGMLSLAMLGGGLFVYINQQMRLRKVLRHFSRMVPDKVK